MIIDVCFRNVGEVFIPKIKGDFVLPYVLSIGHASADASSSFMLQKDMFTLYGVLLAHK